MGGLSERVRLVLLLALACVAVAGLGALAARVAPAGEPLGRSAQVVVVAAPPGLRLADLEGAAALVASANVDSPDRTPRSAWATVGAGAAVDGRGERPGRGRLGDALHRAGRRTAMVASSAEPLSRLAVADGQGRVDVEARAEGAAGLADQAGGLLGSGAALLLLDAEGLDRPGLDQLLARLRTEPVTTLVVAAGGSAEPLRLAPFLATAPDGGTGGLLSPSTKQVGLVVLADVAPTVLDVLGVDVPAEMTGRPLRRVPTGPTVAELVRADDRSQLRGAVWNRSMAAIGVVLLTVAAWAWLRPGAAPRARAGLCLLVAGWPLATWLARAVPGGASASQLAVVMAAALDVAAVALAWVACKGRPLAALAAVLGATVALVTVDLGVGGPLQVSSAFGSDASSAGRFYGLGNGAFAAYAGAAAVLVATARRRAPWVPALLLLVTLAVALPALGNDVGGALTAAPVFGLATAALWGRLSWRALAVLAASTALLLAAALAIDLSRPAAGRTHLARFVTGSDQSATLARRLGTNLDQYVAQPGLAVVVLLAAALVVLLARGKFAAALPAGSPARIGVLSALGIALLGNALNDSGAVVTAVVALLLVPYLVLLSPARLRGRAEGHG